MVGSRPQSHGYAVCMEKSLELSITLVRFLPTATTTETIVAATTIATATTKNNTIATLVLPEGKSKFWRQRFR